MPTPHRLKHKRETCREALFHPIFQHLSNPNISRVNLLDMRNHYLLRVALLFFQLYHLEDGKWIRRNGARLTNRELWWVQLNHTPLKFCVSRSMGIPRLTIKIRNSLTGKEPTTCNTSVTATSSWPGPVIMGGDFNHELSSLPIWKSLEEYGWKERGFLPLAIHPSYHPHSVKEIHKDPYWPHPVRTLFSCVPRFADSNPIWVFGNLRVFLIITLLYLLSMSQLNLEPLDNGNSPGAYLLIRFLSSRLQLTNRSHVLSR